MPTLSRHRRAAYGGEAGGGEPAWVGIYLIQQCSEDGVEMRSGDGQTEFIMWFNLRETPATLQAAAPAASLPAPRPGYYGRGAPRMSVKIEQRPTD